MGIEKYKVKKLFEIRQYKFKELVAMYKVNPRTLNRWLNEIEVKINLEGGYYKISQVEIIREYLGFPYLIYDMNAECPEENFNIKPFEIRPYKFRELAELYGVHPNTMRKMIEPFRQGLGEINGKYLIIPQVEVIITEMDLPYTIEEVKGEGKNGKAA